MKKFLNWFKKHKGLYSAILAAVFLLSSGAAVTPAILSTYQTGGGTSQTSDETGKLDPETSDNVDNSDEENDSSNGSNGGSTSDNNSGSDNSNSSATSDGGEVSASTANDLGVYSGLTDDDGNEVVYWISDSSYYSDENFSGGSGTEFDPYLISSAKDLAYLSYTIFIGNNISTDCYFLQTCDIDLSGTEYNSNGLYWMPIGGHCSSGVYNASTVYSFRGYYDGGNHSISNMKTYSDGSGDTFTSQGLFGAVFSVNSYTKAEISSIVIRSSIINAYSYAGGLVGWSNHSIIKNCLVSNDTTIYGVDSSFGGIIGALGDGSIQNCSNYATIKANYGVGGIVGIIYTGVDVSNCYNAGNVTAIDSAGGIVGGITIGTVSNCYNCAEIEGTRNIGGIVGNGQNTSTSSVTAAINCFNVGKVSSGSSCGGVDGTNSDKP